MRRTGAASVALLVLSNAAACADNPLPQSGSLQFALKCIADPFTFAYNAGKEEGAALTLENQKRSEWQAAHPGATSYTNTEAAWTDANYDGWGDEGRLGIIAAITGSFKGQTAPSMSASISPCLSAQADQAVIGGDVGTYKYVKAPVDSMTGKPKVCTVSRRIINDNYPATSDSPPAYTHPTDPANNRPAGTSSNGNIASDDDERFILSGTASTAFSLSAPAGYDDGTSVNFEVGLELGVKHGTGSAKATIRGTPGSGLTAPITRQWEVVVVVKPRGAPDSAYQEWIPVSQRS